KVSGFATSLLLEQFQYELDREVLSTLLKDLSGANKHQQIVLYTNIPVKRYLCSSTNKISTIRGILRSHNSRIKLEMLENWQKEGMFYYLAEQLSQFVRARFGQKKIGAL